ncbi:hypothetical protein PV10_02753 [Exophiala mesophila]|uniref:Peptidase M20 dimerisation domain-containing protein n=1 Tax=Exophiala mesophila TaxID=212818 RepID=A0A0D1Y3A5_EXOME|nr:uncharacterized protein PV10_02753 [Exophiala mesophila]KIV95051.1 hypothetical protein PV10_02753 [Exophiala mesophila]
MGDVGTLNQLGPEYKSLKINPSRFNDALQYSCQWGATDDGGMNRLSGNDDDKAVRDWFIAETAKHGCSHKVDTMGNIFAIRPGQNNDLPPIGLGSHLDTQPTGGRYDGILGVHCALEVLRVIDEAGITTYAPLAIINWTNEEGARFPPAMLGSGVWAGQYTLDHGHSRESVEGVSMAQELERIGYMGKVPCSSEQNPLSAHFEVHIEQGTILEKEIQPVGVVKGAQSVRWFRLVVSGRAQHTGGTPMEKRCDAILAAAKVVILVHQEATDRGIRATVSTIKSDPQSMNTIAGKAELSLDLRAPSDADMDDLEASLRQSFEKIQAETRTKFEMLPVWNSPAEFFDESMVECVRQSAKELGSSVEMMSFIGHDSVYTSKIVPTAMIFARCRDGISHSPDEYTSPEEYL